MQQILARRERKAKRKAEKEAGQASAQANGTTPNAPTPQKDLVIEAICEGNYVKIRGTKSVGYIESIQGKNAIVVMGDIRTKMPLSKLEQSEKPEAKTALTTSDTSLLTRNVIDTHRNNFSPEIDVRGMRGDEALLKVQHFVDDAILMSMSRIRILHGKGNGILRTLIRQYLEAIPNVISCKDEHVQFGGAGITVVEIG